LPARRGEIAPFYVMEVMKAAGERAAAGADVLHLEVGQPSTGAPEGVLGEAERALRSSPLGYTDAMGIPELRERIARHYVEQCGVTVDAARVVVTTGASGAFVLAKEQEGSLPPSFRHPPRTMLRHVAGPAGRSGLPQRGRGPARASTGKRSTRRLIRVTGPPTTAPA
jgi:hypothetical protein